MSRLDSSLHAWGMKACARFTETKIGLRAKSLTLCIDDLRRENYVDRLRSFDKAHTAFMRKVGHDDIFEASGIAEFATRDFKPAPAFDSDLRRLAAASPAKIEALKRDLQGLREDMAAALAKINEDLAFARDYRAKGYYDEKDRQAIYAYIDEMRTLFEEKMGKMFVGALTQALDCSMDPSYDSGALMKVSGFSPNNVFTPGLFVDSEGNPRYRLYVLMRLRECKESYQQAHLQAQGK